MPRHAITFNATKTIGSQQRYLQGNEAQPLVHAASNVGLHGLKLKQTCASVDTLGLRLASLSLVNADAALG